MIKILTYDNSEALAFAAKAFQKRGISVTDIPDPEVTHLLLPIPTKEPLEKLPEGLSEKVHIIGGGAKGTALTGHRVTDLLKDPGYLAGSAIITAHCALQVAMDRLPVTLEDLPILVIGWGRIGKQLSALLKKLDARVTVAARKESDRSALEARWFSAIPVEGLDPSPYRVIFNTAPAMVLPNGGTALKIDLASVRGIGGKDVIWARGLPGKYAPESAGALIAARVEELLQKEAPL